MESIEERIAALVEGAVENEGYHLVDLEYKGDSRSGVLRIFIDKPEGGVSVDDCQKVSEMVSPMLDVENVIEGRYFLEVSSPGINRRIRKREDFERFAGSRVKIQLRSPLDGRKNITGVIEGVEENEVVVRDRDKANRVPLAAISRANLQVL